MINETQLIKWFTDRRNKLTYSMLGSRNGSDGTADCSGAMTEALYRSGGLYAPGVISTQLYSTVNLNELLTKVGYRRIAINTDWDAISGDIILMSFDSRGMAYSAGAGGHVGVMENSDIFISVDYTNNGAKNSTPASYPWNDYYNANAFQYIEVWRLNEYGDNVNTSAGIGGSYGEPSGKQTSAIELFKRAGNEYVITNDSTYQVDKSSDTEVINYVLAGGQDATFNSNGIPRNGVEWVSDKTFRFKKSTIYGHIEDYDESSNGVAIRVDNNKLVWFDADVILHL